MDFCTFHPAQYFNAGLNRYLMRITIRQLVPLCAGLCLSTATAQAQSGAAIQSFTARVAGRSVKVVKVRLDSVRLKAGLGQGLVGRTEPLANIARRYRAVAAINGGYFAAYKSTPIKNPVHTLITNGQTAHIGKIGSLLGFTAASEARIERVPLKIEGSLNNSFKWPDGWYAYWINRLPEGSRTITIFTPRWGRATGLNDGTQVVVANNTITQVGKNLSQPIPSDGFVIYFKGEDEMAARMKLGHKCAYRVVREDGGELGFWSQVREAVGCGPRLLTDGRITVNPAAEGFTDPKVTSLSTQRSMVGLTRDGWLLLATSSGTMRQMADVMKGLGAAQAMNLDGGASSGLWLRGKYLTSPGRHLNNALLVLEKK